MGHSLLTGMLSTKWQNPARKPNHVLRVPGWYYERSWIPRYTKPTWDVLCPPCCHFHMIYQHPSCRFTAIHNSSSVASWDCKEFIRYTLSRSSKYFCPLFYENYELRHTTCLAYCSCLLYSREVGIFGCKESLAFITSIFFSYTGSQSERLLTLVGSATNSTCSVGRKATNEGLVSASSMENNHLQQSRAEVQICFLFLWLW